MFLELPALLQAEIAQELTKDALAKSDILNVPVSVWMAARCFCCGLRGLPTLWSEGFAKLVPSGNKAVDDTLGTCPAPGSVSSIHMASPLTLLWVSALAACKPRSVVRVSVCV